VGGAALYGPLCHEFEFGLKFGQPGWLAMNVHAMLVENG